MSIECKKIVRSLRGAEAAGEADASAPRAFTSKIGRLPEAVRLELNGRLQDSTPARDILDWLSALPEVQAVMASQFGGAPVTEDNVSRWRQTGYAAWQAGTATLESLRQLSQWFPGWIQTAGGLGRPEPARPGTDEPLPDNEDNNPDIVSPAQKATVPPPPHPAH